jgi:recombination protein RecR
MKSNNEIEQLIYLFSKLPGLGTRSARRIVLHLLQDKDIRLKSLTDSLLLAMSKITKCIICHNIDYSSICNICSSDKRDEKIIAIVESAAELWAIERSDIFYGQYHVLNNLISCGRHSPNDLRLPELAIRCVDKQIQEIIIATNATIEGQTTAYFISDYFKNSKIKISRLATGIPIGGELDYLDEGTLSLAITLRQIFD